LLELALTEFGFLVEGIDDLAEELVLDNAPFLLSLEKSLGVLEEGVEFLVICLCWSLGRLSKVPQNIELQQELE